MDRINKNSALYYSTVFLFSLSAVSLLIVSLNWPMIAAITLGTCLMIQIMYLSKKLLDTWRKAYAKGMTPQFSTLLYSFVNGLDRKTESEVEYYK